ncbi:MAG: hypothetical protein RJP95_00850 [Pirellulales bacterium]
MTTNVEDKKVIGVALAKRLGLKVDKVEGHDLAGPCISCKSSDAFRLHKHKGIAHCYSCDGRWSPYQVALKVLKDRKKAMSLMSELEIALKSTRVPVVVEPSCEQDALCTIADQKHVDPEAFEAYGAEIVNSTRIEFPLFDPDGDACSSYQLFTDDSKGKFAFGKPVGLFFPHKDGVVRLPQPGETWHIVEGVKDAAALHSLGYLACGLNTCHMAAKFARLFADTKVVLVPDRDQPGLNGANRTTAGLWGVAASISMATLPVGFKETKGLDVRDVLQLENGEELLIKAIADAKLIESPPGTRADNHDISIIKIAMPEGDPISLAMTQAANHNQCVLDARRGDLSHRDQLNPNSSGSRKRFVEELAKKIGGDFSLLFSIIEPRILELADAYSEEPGQSGGKISGKKDSQATIAAEMWTGWELWHTQDDEAYVTFSVNEHAEHWPVTSQKIKRHLSKCFFDEQGTVMSSEALTSAIHLLEGQALFDGEEHEVHVRMAEYDDKLYLDLCNPEWQVVEITAAGWRVLNESPVKFRRSEGMRALPGPEHGGSIDELRHFLNVDDDSWSLIVAWIVSAFRPRGPHPLLGVFAEQGSGKSTAGRHIRKLIDPNRAPLRSEGRNVHELMLAANNSWCLAYDNISYVTPQFSDALCRMSTGGGFTTRKLYCDQEEQIFDARRPVLLTSIEEVVTRADLIDRCVIVRLQSIAEGSRRPEDEIDRAFDEAHPRILGALLDAVSGALRNLPSTKLPRLPRMADFAMWATAAEEALGWASGTFMQAYERNRESANELAIEASPIGPPLLSLLRQHGKWEGTSTQLLRALKFHANEDTTRLRIWPKNGKSMSDHLERIRPNLRAIGWEIDRKRESQQRTLIIRPVCGAAEDSCDSPEDSVIHEHGNYDASDVDDACVQPVHREAPQDDDLWRALR